MMGPKPKFDDATFVRAFRACETMEQTARRLGVNVASVKTRVRKLRAQGLTLPRQRVCP